MSNILPILSTLFVALLIQGCATTRVVKTQPQKGGVIMVQEGLFGDARAEARHKMVANCGRRKVKIVEEGEAVIGKHSQTSVSKNKHGSSASSDSEDKREWRIRYKCLSGKKAPSA